jgi:hypothetical protein
MAITRDALDALDRSGYRVIDVITHGGRESSTLSTSNTFIGVNGITYWVKINSQQGLVAELVAGRLAATTAGRNK